MKIYFFLVSILIKINALFCQSLVKQWDFRYGGTLTEHSVCKPMLFQDNSILVSTSSQSDSTGNKTKYLKGGSDIWLVKVGPNGKLEWEKSYIGNAGESLVNLIGNTDNSLIVAATSSSTIGYDKTSSNIGFGDFWIIKLDSAGNIMWDKTKGSLATDALVSIVQNSNGGYVLGGVSAGGIGGDKTEPSWGTWDVWLISIDSIGNKLWDKRIGGVAFDKLTNMVSTADGGFLLAIQSSSGVTGDKTVADYGDFDYWVVRLDSLGQIVWQKTYGGVGADLIFSITPLSDGNVLLGGVSMSNAGGTKTQNTKDTSQTDVSRMGDYWIVKIDPQGNQLWDKDFGGQDAENKMWNIEQTYDGGFIITGNSYSNQSGDKTEDNNGNAGATWIVKTDSAGNIQWEKTIKLQPGFLQNELSFTIQNHDSCYTTLVSTVSGIGGYKTQPNWDTTGQTNDIWIIKHCVTSSNIGYSNFQLIESGIITYPNPSTGRFWIRTNISTLNSSSVFIYSPTGELIYTKENVFDNVVQVDLTNRAKGIYFVKVIQQNRMLLSKLVRL